MTTEAEFRDTLIFENPYNTQDTLTNVLHLDHSFM